MNLIKEEVFKRFSEWAAENENKSVYSEINSHKESYYIDRNSDETYMMEYSINTLHDLRDALYKYSGLSADYEMLKMVTTEMCRNRYKAVTGEAVNKEDNFRNQSFQNNQETLPEYIYVF